MFCIFQEELRTQLGNLKEKMKTLQEIKVSCDKIAKHIKVMIGHISGNQIPNHSHCISIEIIIKTSSFLNI